MTVARSQFVDVNVSPWYHVISRSVCGVLAGRGAIERAIKRQAIKRDRSNLTKKTGHEIKEAPSAGARAVEGRTPILTTSRRLGPNVRSRRVGPE